jgi:methionyl-tRNA formyltransferase
VTVADKITADDRRLDPAAGAAALARRVRALNPHVGTWVELPGGDRLGVRRATVGGSGGDAPPAGALAAVDGRLLLGTSDEALELLEVQPPGGRAMEAAAWLRGQGARIVG